MKPATKERLFLWGAAPLLAAGLGLLAVLQYHWSVEVSAATRSQMQSNLHIALLGFRQDLARELAATCAELRSEIVESSDPADWSQQFRTWQSASSHPTLVSHAYVWRNTGDAQLLGLDTAHGQSETVDWPDSFSRLHQRLQEMSPPADRQAADNGPHGRRAHALGDSGLHAYQFHAGTNGPSGHPRRTRDQFPVAWIDQSVPALAYPVRNRVGADDAPRPPTFSWIIVQLDRNTLNKEIFPELTQKYFTRAGHLDYQVAVLENSSGAVAQEVMYSS